MSVQPAFSDILTEWSELFMQHSFHAFKHFMDNAGLSPSQTSTLMRLYHGRSCLVSEIGSHVGVTNAAASQMIEKLVQMELVERSEDPEDRRTRHLRLTEKGRQLIQQAFSARKEWLEAVIASMPAERRSAIIQAIEEMTNAAKSMQDATGIPHGHILNKSIDSL